MCVCFHYCSPADGHIGYFSFLAIVNRATVAMAEQVPVE